MFKKYKVLREGNFYIVEKYSFPRMNLKIDCKNLLPNIIGISVLEECSPTEIKRGIEEIWNYFIKYLKK
jgi:hypothetical protein